MHKITHLSRDMIGAQAGHERTLSSTYPLQSECFITATAKSGSRTYSTRKPEHFHGVHVLGIIQ
jgi:hypothetical protein